MVSGHDGHAVLRRLNNIVPAARHQASSDERHVGQCIERGQFSDGIDQQHSARQRFSLPLRAPERLECPSAAAGSQPRRSARDAAAPESSPRADVLTRKFSNAFSSGGSSSSTVLPQTSTGPAPSAASDWRRLSTIGGGAGRLTSNFRFPVTCTRALRADRLQPRGCPLASAPETGRRAPASAAAPSENADSAATTGQRCARSPPRCAPRSHAPAAGSSARTPSRRAPPAPAARPADTAGSQTQSPSGSRKRSLRRIACEPVPARCRSWSIPARDAAERLRRICSTSPLTASTSPTETAWTQMTRAPPAKRRRSAAPEPSPCARQTRGGICRGAESGRANTAGSAACPAPAPGCRENSSS